MYCHNCGHGNISSANYCVNCGHKINDTKETTSVSETTQNNSTEQVRKQRCRCGEIKRNVFKEYQFSGQRVCLKCSKKGFCPICGHKLRTKSAEQCGKCGSSWRENPTHQNFNSSQIFQETFTKKHSEEEKIKCPNCKSKQITANKKGFSGVKAVGGAVLTGGIGVLAGTIGSNKILLTCLSCGKRFNVGDDFEGMKKKRKHEEKVMKSPLFWIFYIGLLAFIVWLISSC